MTTYHVLSYITNETRTFSNKYDLYAYLIKSAKIRDSFDSTKALFEKTIITRKDQRDYNFFSSILKRYRYAEAQAEKALEDDDMEAFKDIVDNMQELRDILMRGWYDYASVRSSDGTLVVKRNTFRWRAFIEEQWGGLFCVTVDTDYKIMWDYIHSRMPKTEKFESIIRDVMSKAFPEAKEKENPFWPKLCGSDPTLISEAVARDYDLDPFKVFVAIASTTNVFTDSLAEYKQDMVDGYYSDLEDRERSEVLAKQVEVARAKVVAETK